jgi:SAM-dependent methyltransferase
VADPDDRNDLSSLARAFVDASSDPAVKQGYLRWFAGAGPVLDIGCGSGTFLDVLRLAGRAGRGIDASPQAVAACRSRGHDAICGDAIEVVRGLGQGGERFEGALLAHVVEHLVPEAALRLLRAVAAVLAPGGTVVIATPDPRNRIVLEETFWLDPTHIRPYPAALLAQLCDAVGLRVVGSYRDPATVPRRPAWKRALARVRSVLSGADRSSPLDLVVVARRA